MLSYLVKSVYKITRSGVRTHADNTSIGSLVQRLNHSAILVPTNVKVIVGTMHSRLLCGVVVWCKWLDINITHFSKNRHLFCPYSKYYMEVMVPGD